MATAKKVTESNHLPGTGDGRFIVYSKQFNKLVDVVNEIEPSDGSLVAGTISENVAGAGVTIDGALIKDGGFTGEIITDSVTSESAVGTVGTNVTAVHYGDGRNYTSVLTLSAVSFSVAAAANEAIGNLIYTFPAGAHLLEATYMSVALQGGGTVDADTPDIGIGTTEATGAVALLGGTAAFEDIVDGQTAADCGGTATVAMLNPDDTLSVAGDDKTVYLNIADGWAGADTVTASGTVVIKWTIMS